jgi:ubiquinone/menaquinone biosynthesis C-methylase UbiE
LDGVVNRLLDATTLETIQILPVELLDQNRSTVEWLKKLAAGLGIGLGWHYLLDLSWMLGRLGEVKGNHILDAGAGSGLMQWALAERKAEVTSVDRGSRAGLSLRFRAAYHIEGMRPQDLAPAWSVFKRNLNQSQGAGSKSAAALRGMAGLMKIALPKTAPGRVVIYNTDLRDLALVKDNTMDAVVAVSALEHNQPKDLPGVVKELMRVLRPGGILLATLGAARDEDWFHQPSQGWCYTSQTLAQLFNLPADTSSNYARFDEIFAALKNCAELRDHLAPFYFQSGNNGMPWGVWDPQYPPVGICKVKW